MRRVWALAAAQQRAGLVTPEQVEELRAHADDVDVARSQAIERETRHDVMAEIHAFAEQCPQAGGIIHWGATSADITDNVDVLRLQEATRLIVAGLEALLAALADRIEVMACPSWASPTSSRPSRRRWVTALPSTPRTCSTTCTRRARCSARYGERG